MRVHFSLAATEAYSPLVLCRSSMLGDGAFGTDGGPCPSPLGEPSSSRGKVQEPIVDKVAPTLQVLPNSVGSDTHRR
jgi:hypothetical protein